jgi:hypothetical protein
VRLDDLLELVQGLHMLATLVLASSTDGNGQLDRPTMAVAARTMVRDAADAVRAVAMLIDETEER